MNHNADQELMAATDDYLRITERWHAGGCKDPTQLHRAAGRYARAKEHWAKTGPLA